MSIKNSAYCFNLSNEDPDVVGNLVFIHSMTDSRLGSKNLPDTYKFQQFIGKAVKDVIR